MKGEHGKGGVVSPEAYYREQYTQITTRNKVVNVKDGELPFVYRIVLILTKTKISALI